MKAILTLCLTLCFIVGLEYPHKKEQLTSILLLLLVWLRSQECFSSGAENVDILLASKALNVFPEKVLMDQFGFFHGSISAANATYVFLVKCAYTI